MPGKASDHLANERTFLAWVRTALGLLGLGFVLARMGLFLRQIAVTAGSAEGAGGLTLGRALHTGQEFLWIGVGFLVIGTAVCAGSCLLYARTRRAIELERFEADLWPVVGLTAAVVVGGLVVTGLVIWRVLGGDG